MGSRRQSIRYMGSRRQSIRYMGSRAGKLIMSIIPIIPFKGSAVTSKEKATIPMGGFSMIQNFYPRSSGFEQRKGQAKHHTTADGSLECHTLWQFNKGA